MGPSWQARVAWGALHSWPEHDQRAVMHFPSREDLASSIWGSEVQAGRRSVGSCRGGPPRSRRGGRRTLSFRAIVPGPRDHRTERRKAHVEGKHRRDLHVRPGT